MAEIWEETSGVGGIISDFHHPPLRNPSCATGKGGMVASSPLCMGVFFLQKINKKYGKKNKKINFEVALIR